MARRIGFPSWHKTPIVRHHPAFIFAIAANHADKAQRKMEDNAMKKYFVGTFPFAAMLLLTVVDAAGIRTEPGYGNPQLRTVNDQTGIMKCAKGKHYNTRTRTCDPD